MSDFVKNRMNKDNLWNLVFFLGMSFGFGSAWMIASYFKNEKVTTFACVLCWVIIIGVPWFVKKNSLITFNQTTKQLLDRNRQELNSRTPNFFLLMLLTGGLTALSELVLDGCKDANENLSLAVVSMMPLFIPTMHCILKNFPIATYFKKEYWIGDAKHTLNNNSQFNAHHFSKSKNIQSSNILTSPRYASINGNIFHHK